MVLKLACCPLLGSGYTTHYSGARAIVSVFWHRQSSSCWELTGFYRWLLFLIAQKKGKRREELESGDLCLNISLTVVDPVAAVSDSKFFGWIQLSTMCVHVCTLGKCCSLNAKSHPLCLLVIFFYFYILILRHLEALLDVEKLPSQSYVNTT